MIELLIVILLLYISYKLSKQEAMIQTQNELIDSLRAIQDNCEKHVKKLEKHYDKLDI